MEHLSIVTQSDKVIVTDSRTRKVTTYNCESIEKARKLGNVLRAARVAVEWFERRTLPAGSEAQDIAAELKHTLDRLPT